MQYVNKIFQIKWNWILFIGDGNQKVIYLERLVFVILIKNYFYYKYVQWNVIKKIKKNNKVFIQ